MTGVTQAVFNEPVGAQHVQFLRRPGSVTFSLLKLPVDSRILIMGNLDMDWRVLEDLRNPFVPDHN